MCEGTLTSVGLVREKCYFFFFQVRLTLNDPMRMSLQFGLLCVYFPVFTCNLCILVCVCTVCEQLCKAFLAAPNLLNTWLIVLNAFLVFFNEWLVGLIFDSVLLLQLFNVHSTSVSDIVLIHLWILKIKKKGGEKMNTPIDTHFAVSTTEISSKIFNHKCMQDLSFSFFFFWRVWFCRSSAQITAERRTGSNINIIFNLE